jgi:hypothetical protein
MSGFEDTPEYKLSLAMRPACDAVLCKVWGVPPENIRRFNKASELFVLDREFAIDLQVRLSNGSQVTGQEKTLSNKFHRYRTFTMEFWQNRYADPPEPGEFFKIAAQFYLHGYADASGTRFVEWKILDILRLIDWLKGCGIAQLAKRTRPAGGSRAAFLPIEYDKIPREFIHAELR